MFLLDRLDQPILIGYSDAMPTVIIKDGFEIRIYTKDHDPPHVHVFKAGGQAKVLIGQPRDEPACLISVFGMTNKEARRAEELVQQHQDRLLKAWRKYYGNA